jgi:hypothetical protein
VSDGGFGRPLTWPSADLSHKRRSALWGVRLAAPKIAFSPENCGFGAGPSVRPTPQLGGRGGGGVEVDASNRGGGLLGVRRSKARRALMCGLHPAGQSVRGCQLSVVSGQLLGGKPGDPRSFGRRGRRTAPNAERGVIVDAVQGPSCPHVRPPSPRPIFTGMSVVSS